MEYNKCPICDKEVSAEEKFCPKCGHQMNLDLEKAKAEYIKNHIDEFDRVALKQDAKECFKANYWKMVLVAFISVIANGLIRFVYSIYTSFYETEAGNIDYASMMSSPVLYILCFVFLALTIFALNPLSAGLQKAVLETFKKPTDLKNMGYGFKIYGKSVSKMLLYSLLIAMWYAIGFAPMFIGFALMSINTAFFWVGVLMSSGLAILATIMLLKYFCIPYLIIDEPELSFMDMVRKSKELTDGHKWDIFVFQLQARLYII